MKKLKNLKGTKVLSREEQRFVKGGVVYCDSMTPCPPGHDCVQGICWCAPPGWE